MGTAYRINMSLEHIAEAKERIAAAYRFEITDQVSLIFMVDGFKPSCTYTAREKATDHHKAFLAQFEPMK